MNALVPQAKCQCKVILKHIKMHGSITALEAINRYQIQRLAARIYDLRQAGHQIFAYPERNSEQGYHSRYMFKKEGAE